MRRKNSSPPFRHLLLFRLLLIASSLHLGYFLEWEKKLPCVFVPHWDVVERWVIAVAVLNKYRWRAPLPDEWSPCFAVLLDNEIRCVLWKEFCQLSVFSQEKVQYPVEAQKNELVAVPLHKWCTGRKAGFILLFESYRRRIQLQLLPDRTKHRDFLTAHRSKWII